MNPSQYPEDTVVGAYCTYIVDGYEVGTVVTLVSSAPLLILTYTMRNPSMNSNMMSEGLSAALSI